MIVIMTPCGGRLLRAAAVAGSLGQGLDSGASGPRELDAVFWLVMLVKSITIADTLHVAPSSLRATDGSAAIWPSLTEAGS